MEDALLTDIVVTKHSIDLSAGKCSFYVNYVRSIAPSIAASQPQTLHPTPRNLDRFVD